MPVYSAASCAGLTDTCDFGFGFEGDGAVDDGIDGVIVTHADAGAGVPVGAALADDDVAGDDELRRRTS